MKKRMTVLKAFHKTLCEVAKNMGCDEPYLCEIDQEIRWEGGPFEWAPSLTGGSHLHAGEMGTYSIPLRDEALVKAVAQVKEDGYFIECVNNYSITVYEA